MIQILPAILAHDKEEFLRKVDRVRALGAPLHIDVMDGVFVNNTTWAEPDRMHELLDGIAFEVHLMVSNPEHAVPLWIASGADRVVFHLEATTRERLICRATAEECFRLGLALNPDTPISRVAPLIDTVSEIMVMGVNPGWGGQPFQEIALEKTTALRNLRPSLTISVDGGVKPENAAAIVRAGATKIIAGSGLTDIPDPAAAFLRLKEAVNGPDAV